MSLSRPGFNPKNVNIKADAGTKMDMAFLAHFQVAAADAVALHGDGVRAAMNLGVAVQEILTGITNPAVPRGLSIAGNVAGIAGNVVIDGTDFHGDVISETVALNGVGTVNTTKAFKAVTGIHLPAQTHVPVCQTETIEVTAAAGHDGHVTLTVTAVALGAASPKAVEVALVAATHNTVTKVAEAMVLALNADPDVGDHFVASNAAGVITLTAKVPAADDGTLAIAFADTDTTDVTMGASTNGAAGVPYDTVSVGWSDILGLPYKLSHNTVWAAYLNNAIEAVAATVTVSATVLASNTIKLASALAGTVVDAYLIV